MTYNYDREANRISYQIRGAQVGSVQRRYSKVSEGNHAKFEPADLVTLQYEAAMNGSYGDYWDRLNSKSKLSAHEGEMLELLHYVAGDTW